MLAEVAAALPGDRPVTLLGDRGLPSAALIDTCRAVGGDVVVRLSADAQQGPTVRRADGTMCPAWLPVPANAGMARWRRSGRRAGAPCT
jgi:hypothetical protein